jgi:hypothetical protein
MFHSLLAKLPRDTDYPERQFKMDALIKVLRGAIYDHLQYDFYTESREWGEPIQIWERRPSVRSGLCKTVVDNSVSLLFAEGQFPSVDCEDEHTRNTLRALIRETRLNEVMIEAATVGSCGSVAILLRVLSGRVFFSVLNTQFLTPVWRDDAPDTLESVTEQYKVKGSVLKARSYAIDEEAADYWFRRDWTAEQEIWYQPWKDHEDPDKPVMIDARRTTQHGLGFVPLVWIKNLPGGDAIDGACTFEAAIDTVIQMDYQLSQAGRGLKYSAEPLLMIKASVDPKKPIRKDKGQALQVPPDGDAKMLEINGKSAEAVIGYVRCLREMALESIHGNRANADKINATQSGRAMELLNQPLIWLADKLRISYGEGALLSLLRMVVSASEKYPLTVNGEPIGKLNPKAKLSLRWPRWYALSALDRQQDAQTMKLLTAGGMLSRDTATHILSETWDIGDVEAERQRIEIERKPIGVEINTA